MLFVGFVYSVIQARLFKPDWPAYIVWLFSWYFDRSIASRRYRATKVDHDIIYLSGQYTDPMTRVWLNTTAMSEDCLYLNIWTNAINGSFKPESMEGMRPKEGPTLKGVDLERKRRSSFINPSSPSPSPPSSSTFQQHLPSGRPVMVWIHGGNFVSGSANLELFNGAILASEVCHHRISMLCTDAIYETKKQIDSWWWITTQK